MSDFMSLLKMLQNKQSPNMTMGGGLQTSMPQMPMSPMAAQAPVPAPGSPKPDPRQELMKSLFTGSGGGSKGGAAAINPFYNGGGQGSGTEMKMLSKIAGK